jgi:hypothetical protein
MIAFVKLAESLHISRTKLAKLRDERLSAGEWMVGEGGKQYFTEEGAAKIRLAVQVPLAVPKRIQVKVVGRAPNPRYVYCVEHGKDGRFLAVVKPSTCDRLIGKHIYVDLIEDAKGGITYRHDALAK